MAHTHRKMKKSTRWMLVVFDLLCYLVASALILVFYPTSIGALSPGQTVLYAAVGFAALLGVRYLVGIYRFIWRYAGPREYIWLILSNAAAAMILFIVRELMPVRLMSIRVLSLFCLDLLSAISMRQFYQYLYQNRSRDEVFEQTALKLLRLVTGVSFQQENLLNPNQRINVAIIGAGSAGAILADELLYNPRAVYYPVCFVDVNQEKIGRAINGIPVIDGSAPHEQEMRDFGVQEVIFALPSISADRKKELYDAYMGLGYKIKAYDYSPVQSEEGGRRHLREFDIEELLFRRTSDFIDERTAAWYHGKNVLITGGGGSIGSELARQIAKMGPERLVILDIYENGAYEIEQELRIKYGEQLNMRVEIANICDREEMDKIFSRHTPDIVLHAAAHKHVPLMERNCCEAVRNNVFGTLNLVEASEKYGVKRFILVSTDKAVNPTSVYGATKRMCEMIVQSRTCPDTCFNAVRFGNVLGSNGSVIPLFRRQIAQGGPLTITDKRIIRYFMTIPEASQLVLTSGAIAQGGELYVLDMGRPVRILDLAESMIRLSGLEPGKDIEIIETGLRLGEKLFEELLIKNEEMDRTENNLIFVERDKPLSAREIEEKLEVLRGVLKTESNRAVREALKQVVPTYRSPEEVNGKAPEEDF